jgi:hypothetical protein
MNTAKPAGRISNHNQSYSRMDDYRFAWWLASLSYLFVNPVKYGAPHYWSTMEYAAGADLETWAA